MEIFDAIEGGEVERVRALVRTDPALARARDEQGLSALLHARYRFRLDIVDALLAADPELDVFEAAALGRTERVRELLEREPGLARAWSADGFSALHLASFFGHVDVVALLLERGADVTAEARNAMRVLPLHSAAARGQNEIASRLLAHGAPVDAPQNGGYTALHAAAANGNLELVRLLLAHGADASIRTDGGETPVELARRNGSEAVVELLAPR